VLTGNRQCGIAKHRGCVHFGMKVSAATSCGGYRVERHLRHGCRNGCKSGLRATSRARARGGATQCIRVRSRKGGQRTRGEADVTLADAPVRPVMRSGSGDGAGSLTFLYRNQAGLPPIVHCHNPRHTGVSLSMSSSRKGGEVRSSLQGTRTPKHCEIGSQFTT
jgi:hypothetical protein